VHVFLIEGFGVLVGHEGGEFAACTAIVIFFRRLLHQLPGFGIGLVAVRQGAGKGLSRWALQLPTEIRPPAGRQQLQPDILCPRHHAVGPPVAQLAAVPGAHIDLAEELGVIRYGGKIQRPANLCDDGLIAIRVGQGCTYRPQHAVTKGFPERLGENHALSLEGM